MRHMLAGVVALSVLTALPASADWPAGGTLVSSPGDINGARNALIFDLPSGDLGVLGVGTAGNNFNYNLQHVGRDGSIAAGWPATGLGFSAVLKGTPLRWHGLAMDDSGYVWHSYVGNFSGNKMLAHFATPYAIGSSGLLVVNSAPGLSCRVATAPNGDAFVVCGNRLKRITRAGAVAAGWTSTGVALPNGSIEDTGILPDGAGGVLVFMRGTAGGVPAVTRIDGNAVRHAGWPAAGMPLTDVPPPVVADFPDCDSRLLPAGPGHFIAAWLAPTLTTGEYEFLLQRFDTDGNVDPNWGPTALSLFPTGTFVAMSVIADGAGGVYVVRPGATVPLATHVTSAGTVLGAVDTPVNLPGDQYVPSYCFQPSGPDAMIADRTPNGGLLMGWNDSRTSPTGSFRLRWWNPDLTPDASKPEFACLSGSPHHYPGALLAVHADGDDGAFLAWSDYHDIGFFQISGDLWMTRVQLPQVTGVTPRPGARALALSAPRPNPARAAVALDVTLPDDSPARVELLDVAGRVVRSQAVQGAGAHTVAINELQALAPGLYFARVLALAGTKSTRVVVSL